MYGVVRYTSLQQIAYSKQLMDRATMLRCRKAQLHKATTFKNIWKILKQQKEHQTKKVVYIFFIFLTDVFFRRWFLFESKI